MNQILSVEKKNKKSKKKKKDGVTVGPVSEVVKIVRFFAIALIIFGVFNIGTGAYAMYKNGQEKAKRAEKPAISVESISDKEATLNINSANPINEVYYNWNDEKEFKISGNGRNSIQQVINVPEGENVLHVRAINGYGQTGSYEQTITREAKISIQLEKVDPNIVIKVEAKEQIAYLTYRWNQDEETRIDINSNSTEQFIEVPAGENILTVTAVDVNDEQEVVEKKINGITPGEDPSVPGTELTTKPTIEITTDGSSRFLIKAKDEAGLKRIDLVANDNQEGKVSVGLDGRKEQDFEYPIVTGENIIEVTIYNVNNQSTTSKAKLTKSE